MASKSKTKSPALHNWEYLSSAEEEFTTVQRLRVPGGWIYCIKYYASDTSNVSGGELIVYDHATTNFVPDPNEVLEWEVFVTELA